MPSRRSVLVMAAVSALGATGCGGDPDLAADSRSRDAQPASAPVPRNSSALGREVLDLGPRPVIPGRPLLGAYAGHARPDGSLVVAGEAPVAGRSQTVLAIVGPSGRLIARYSLPGVDSVNGIAERPDDRLVVAGYSEADRQVRLFGRTAGGAPDGSFGRGGTVATGLTAACPRCADAFTDAAGTVTVAAATYGQPLKVRRYTASGTPDQGFAAGQAASPPGAASDVQIAEDPDGGTIVLRVDDSYKATLHRITGAGVVDPYFGRDGSVALPGDGSFSSLAVRPDGRIDVGIPSSGGPRDNVTLLRFDKSGHQPRSINVGVGALWGAFAASDGSTVVVRTDGQARTRVLRVSASGRIVRNRLVSLPLGGAAYDADGSASPVETNFLDPVDLDRNDALVFAGGMNLVRYADFAATLGNGAGLTASRFALARLNQQDRPDRSFGATPRRLRVRLDRQSELVARITLSEPGSCTVRLTRSGHAIAAGADVLLTTQPRAVRLRLRNPRRSTANAKLRASCRSQLGSPGTAQG